MKTKKLMLIWSLATVFITVIFFFSFRELDYRGYFSQADLSGCPETSKILKHFYQSWNRQDWDSMEKVPFGNLDSEFYKHKLSNMQLDNYNIIDYEIIDEDRIQFQVMLTINGSDALVDPKLAWNYDIEYWSIIDHQFEFERFDYDGFRTYLYNLKSLDYTKYTIAVFVALLASGIIALLISKHIRLMARKSLD